eukprot:3941475-Rhodomonas_salina.2
MVPRVGFGMRSDGCDCFGQGDDLTEIVWDDRALMVLVCVFLGKRERETRRWSNSAMPRQTLDRPFLRYHFKTQTRQRALPAYLRRKKPDSDLSITAASCVSRGLLVGSSAEQGSAECPTAHAALSSGCAVPARSGNASHRTPRPIRLCLPPPHASSAPSQDTAMSRKAKCMPEQHTGTRVAGA